MRNILVTGANGQLGSELRVLLSQMETKQNNYIFTSRSKGENGVAVHKLAGNYKIPKIETLDITKTAEVADFIKEHNITAVINCAAYTNVDKAEEDFLNADEINYRAARNLAYFMKEVDGTLIHISTDYVFGGENHSIPYTESDSDKCYPISVYGITKFQAERALKIINGKHTIIRTSWLYSEFGKNFLKTMIDLIEYKDEIKIVFDQVGTPTYARDLALFILFLTEKHLDEIDKDVYNFSNEGVCSWYDFAVTIKKILQNKTCEIKPCHTNEFPAKAKRPSYSVLDKTKVKEKFDYIIPYWSDQVEQCIINYKKLHTII